MTDGASRRARAGGILAASSGLGGVCAMRIRTLALSLAITLAVAVGARRG